MTLLNSKFVYFQFEVFFKIVLISFNKKLEICSPVSSLKQHFDTSFTAVNHCFYLSVIVSPIKLQRYLTFQRSKFKFKTCRYLAKYSPFACLKHFERSSALQLYGTYYINVEFLRNEFRCYKRHRVKC